MHIRGVLLACESCLVWDTKRSALPAQRLCRQRPLSLAAAVARAQQLGFPSLLKSPILVTTVTAAEGHKTRELVRSS